jgi:catechol 2,3-dioxygenase-like lactoylglutathione lyase family enzyme
MSDSPLKLKFISHGTLECRNLEFTRQFYEEFMGFEVVKTSDVSIWFRLGGTHVYACIQSKRKGVMDHFAHNGIDVESDAQVDECHRIITQDAEKWKLHKISKPQLQHGAYSFYFWDGDDNCWEILSNPPGGYSWMFERGDQQGIGHRSRNFQRPALSREADAQPTQAPPRSE